jgi:hypothetical protein
MTTALIQKIKQLAQAGLDRQIQELEEHISESDEIKIFVEALLDETNDELSTLFYQLSEIDITTPCFNPYHLSPNWVDYLNGFIHWYREGEVNFEFQKTNIGAYEVKKTEEGRSSLYHLIQIAEENENHYNYKNNWMRMFHLKGVLFSQRYLAGHLDFKRKENIIAVFKAAGYDITEEDIAYFQQYMPFTIK